LKDGKYVICVACYSSGRFPSTMHSGGFVRMDDEAFKHVTAAEGGEWSDQETLLLLEGIEMYDEDWLKVAEHVGTRSKEQCVMHFLQLPIEDQYLDEPGAELGPLRFASKSLNGSASGGLPFSKADNPVMSVVAFLASAVGPGVAAAAAQKALGELTDGLKAGIKASADRAAEVDAAAAEKEKDVESKKSQAEQDGMMVDESTTAVAGEDSTGEPKVEKDDVEMDKEDGGREKSVNAGETTTSTEVAAASTGLPHSHVQHVATLALGAAAAKASALAVHEERQLESLVTRLVSAQMKKLELKLGMFEKFEEMLEQEKRQLEIQKQQFFKDKLSLQSQLANAQELLNKARAGQNPAQVAADVAKAIQASAPQSTAGGVQPVPMEGVEVPTDGSIKPLT
jgi:SWI/SNF related-matrix-associated actin-dependent regulator of chromatin subfamily C